LDEIRKVFFISDTHAGCGVALCPPSVRLDTGGLYHQGDVQRKIYTAWEEYTKEWIPRQAAGEPWALVHMGDSLDGDHHGAKTQFTKNFATQENVAYDVLAPLVEKCKGGYYHIRGTEAHVGQCAENEERLAKRLGAIPGADGNCTRYELRLRLGGALCHFTHHISAGRRPDTRVGAVARELYGLLGTAGLWGGEPPSVIARGHVHKNVTASFPTARGQVHGFTMAAWQAKGPYSWRIGATDEVQLGGSMIGLDDDGEIYTRHKVWGIVSEGSVEVPTIRGQR
jgi:hypothetical protein